LMNSGRKSLDVVVGGGVQQGWLRP
jgi:hypothetical protein